MVRLVLSGMDRWRRVSAGRLQVDGLALTTPKGHMFVTSVLQEQLMEGGHSMYTPNLSHFMNDLPFAYLVHPQAFNAVASDCFIRLGQGESRAMAATAKGDRMGFALLAQQRICEAALAFNLLATGGKWRGPGARMGRRYWKKDWVKTCDGYIKTLKQAPIPETDFGLQAQLQADVRDLKLIRDAFAAGV
jgi:hypothetical protein